MFAKVKRVSGYDVWVHVGRIKSVSNYLRHENGTLSVFSVWMDDGNNFEIYCTPEEFVSKTAAAWKGELK